MKIRFYGQSINNLDIKTYESQSWLNTLFLDLMLIVYE